MTIHFLTIIPLYFGFCLQNLVMYNYTKRTTNLENGLPLLLNLLLQLPILHLRFPIPQLVTLLLHWFLQSVVGFVVASVVIYNGLCMTIISLIL